MTISFDAAKKIVKAKKKAAEAENARYDKLIDLYQCHNWGEAHSAVIDGMSSGDDDLVTESGAGFAFIDTMAASVVPSNPQITCEARSQNLEKTAKHFEVLVNYTFQRLNAHNILWQLACRAGVFPYAVLKLVWDLDTRRPKALVLTPKTFWFDTEAVRWEDVRYYIEAVPMTREDVEKKVKDGLFDSAQAEMLNFGQYPTWMATRNTGRISESEEVRKQFQWTVLYEFYDLTSPAGGFFVLHPECKQPLLSDTLPYTFVRNNYHLLTFNDNLEDIRGMSDIELIENPVRRKDELLSLKLRFAQATIAATLVDGSAVDDAEAAKAKLSKATGPWDMVDLNITDGKSMKDVIGSTGTPQFNPAFDEIEQSIDQEIAFRLGMPEYSRGQTGSSDVATAYALVDANLQTRQGRRQIRINDVVRFMAATIVGLYEEFLRADDTIRLRLDKKGYMALARKDMVMRDPARAAKMREMGQLPEPPLDVDYIVAAYSPMESNKANQLRKLSQFKEVLFGVPTIDQQKLYTKLFELLEWDDMTVEEQPAGPQQDPNAVAAAQGAPMPPGAGPEGAAVQPAEPAAAQGFAPQTAFDQAATQGRSVAREHPVMPPNARGGPGLPGTF